MRETSFYDDVSERFGYICVRCDVRSSEHTRWSGCHINESYKEVIAFEGQFHACKHVTNPRCA